MDTPKSNPKPVFIKEFKEPKHKANGKTIKPKRKTVWKRLFSDDK